MTDPIVTPEEPVAEDWHLWVDSLPGTDVGAASVFDHVLCTQGTGNEPIITGVTTNREDVTCPACLALMEPA